MAVEAMSQFTTVLNGESNEAMIVHTITELTKWVKLCPSSVPAPLIERMKVSNYIIE